VVFTACWHAVFKVFYRLEQDRIIVFRILHARRDHLGFLEQGIKIAAEIKTTSSLNKNSITGRMSQSTSLLDK
jgi:hypothetical protein